MQADAGRLYSARSELVRRKGTLAFYRLGDTRHVSERGEDAIYQDSPAL